MLTKLTVRNFKRFADVQIDLGDAVVFIGPNNSGKTSALQALALWQVGLSRWREKRKGKGAPEYWVAVVRPGRVLFELEGVSIEMAQRAMKLGSAKLPLKTRFVRRGMEDQ